MGGWTHRNCHLRQGILYHFKTDIICLTETHLKDKYMIELQGYKWFGYNRQSQHKKASKASGGVDIVVASYLFSEYNINIVDSSLDGILVMKLINYFTGHSLLVACCYLPPENSPWGRDSVLFYISIVTVTHSCVVVT